MIEKTKNHLIVCKNVMQTPNQKSHMKRSLFSFYFENAHYVKTSDKNR